MNLLPLFLQLSSGSKRVNVVDDDEHVDDDWEMSRAQQAGGDIDLFDDGEESRSSTNGTSKQKGDNADTCCNSGMRRLCLHLKHDLHLNYLRNINKSHLAPLFRELMEVYMTCFGQNLTEM